MTVRDEVIGFLTTLMRDGEEDSRNRLKAAELLRKFEEEKDGEDRGPILVQVEYL